MPKRSMLSTVLQLTLDPQQMVFTQWCADFAGICYNNHMTGDHVEGLTIRQGGCAMVTLLEPSENVMVCII